MRMETFLRLVVVVFFFLSTHQHHNVMLTLFVRNGAFDLLSKLNHAFLLVLKKIKSQRVNYVRKLLACIDKFKVQLIVSGFLAKNGLFKMAHLLITSSPNNSARRSDRLDPYRTTLRDERPIRSKPSNPARRSDRATRRDIPRPRPDVCVAYQKHAWMSLWTRLYAPSNSPKCIPTTSWGQSGASTLESL